MAASVLRVAGVVLLYWVVSITLVFGNKYLIDGEGDTIPAILFMTWFQCVVTVVFIVIMGMLGTKIPSLQPTFMPVTIDWNEVKGVARLSVVFVGMIAFNNACLKLVQVAFYNVARSLSILFSALLTYFILGKTVSKLTMGSLLIVIAGFFVGSTAEVKFSLQGTIFGVISSFLASLNSIETKKALEFVGKSEWRLMFYNNLIAVVLFIPVMFLTGEIDTLIEYQDVLMSSTYWTTMLITGVLGVLIGFTVTLQIKTTSPLSHNMSGTAKNSIQTVLAVVVFDNQMNVASALGVVLVIAGSSFYTWVQVRERTPEPPKQVVDEDVEKALPKPDPLPLPPSDPTAKST